MERDDRLALDAAALAGEILLESGAEIFRVEDTIYRIAAAYGAEEAEAFVLSSGIFLTSEGEGRKTFARVKHIPLVGARLDRVSAVNQLSREIEQGLHTPEAAMERLEAIRLLHDLNVGMVVRLALDSRSASGMPCKRASEVFRTYDAEFLDMLEHCGVDLFGLGALLAREEDAE